MAVYESIPYSDYGSSSTTNTPGLPEPGYVGGRVRSCMGNILPTSAPVAGDIGYLFRIPSNARILQLFIEMDDQGGATTTVDIGVYNAADLAIVDINLYGSALDGATAFSRSDVRHETLNHNTMGQKIWQDLGLSADPNTIYVIAATWLVVATGIAGDISFACMYTVD